MDVALKIWRYDSRTGERELKQYEVEAPDPKAAVARIKAEYDGYQHTVEYFVARVA